MKNAQFRFLKNTSWITGVKCFGGQGQMHIVAVSWKATRWRGAEFKKRESVL